MTQIEPETTPVQCGNRLNRMQEFGERYKQPTATSTLGSVRISSLIRNSGAALAIGLRDDADQPVPDSVPA
jgi:hypothetical protein